MRRFSRRTARAGSHSAREWGGALFSVSGLVGGNISAGWALSPLDALSLDDPCTLRHFLTPSFQVTTTAGGSAFVGIGVIVASGDPDSATVPTIFPEPITDPEADWLIRVVYAIAPGITSTHWDPVLDLLHQTKTKRRIRNTEGLLIVAESADVTMNVTADYRYLVNLK